MEPQAQTGDTSFGVRTNQFGFNITGSSNLVIVVEACTNFVNPVWSVLSTNTLNTFVGTNGISYFSDAEWTIIQSFLSFSLALANPARLQAGQTHFQQLQNSRPGCPERL